MGLEELCRRRMRHRISAIATAIEFRENVLATLARPMPSAERIERDSRLRWARAQAKAASCEVARR